MKGLSNGYIFDTKLATLVAEHSTKELGGSKIYRSENGRYFIHNQFTDEPETLQHLVNGHSDIDDLINEWNEVFEEQAIIYFDEFQVG